MRKENPLLPALAECFFQKKSKMTSNYFFLNIHENKTIFSTKTIVQNHKMHYWKVYIKLYLKIITVSKT